MAKITIAEFIHLFHEITEPSYSHADFMKLFFESITVIREESSDLTDQLKESSYECKAALGIDTEYSYNAKKESFRKYYTGKGLTAVFKRIKKYYHRDYVKAYIDEMPEYVQEELLDRFAEYLPKSANLFSISDDMADLIDSLIRDSVNEEKAKRENSGEKEKDEKAGRSAAKKTDAVKRSLEFSKRFLRSGASNIIDSVDKNEEEEFERIADLFTDITIIRHGNETVRADNIARTLLFIVEEGCAGENNNILKIRGPLGSYKNRLVQYLYLNILKACDDILPFYIDLSMYEKAGNEKGLEPGRLYEKLFAADFKAVKKIADSCKERTPLIILDGIRDFSCGRDSLYSGIAKKVTDSGFKVISCMNTDFTSNKHNKIKFHPLAPSNFEYYLRITSMQLYSEAQSIRFIEKCIDIFDIETHGVSARKIYDKLVEMDLVSIDAYWLVHLLRLMLDNIMHEELTISDLYHALCVKFIGDEELINSAAELAFNYEYNRADCSESDFCYDPRWKLIRKHRSMLDYLIALHYVNKLSELDFGKSREEVVADLQFFNMVLQKNITRFIISMVNDVDDYEHKVMTISEYYYKDLSVLGKSELTYWLGRMKNNVRKKRSVKYLRLFKETEESRLQNPSLSEFKRRNCMFLLRGINVSLIYEKDRDALREYMTSLLNDKTANEINRGFHLEYYGDKFFIPNKTLLDFRDVLSSGKNTLNILCLSLEKKLSSKSFDYVAVLELFTLCSLIQARIESRSPGVLDVSEYLSKTCRYLEWILGRDIPSDLTGLREYFDWVLEEFSYVDSTEDKKYDKESVYGLFGTARYVVRRGWEDRNVPYPENIVEHMYNCWLMGLLYLPDRYEDEDYNKQTILNMLLIHDLGETVTGDISRPQKATDPEFYRKQENLALQALLLSDTYPSMPSFKTQRDCWNAWYHKKDINYETAGDIDDIQAIYQYCEYCLTNPECFTDNDIRDWLGGLDKLNTDIGKDMARMLIIDNGRFASIIDKYYKNK